MNQLTDNVIIEKVLAGDTEAYRELVSRHSGQVFSLVSGIVRNREDAEELTSDVFLKAFGQLNKFRGDSKFSTWLYRIAYNTAVSHTRRRKNPTIEIDERRMEDMDDGTEEQALKEARLEELEKALERLPGGDKALIELFYMQELSIDEISQITDDTQGNIKVKLYRTRKKLAAMINGQI